MEQEFSGDIFDSVARFGESAGVTSAGHQLGSLRDKVIATTQQMGEKISATENSLFNQAKDIMLKASGFTSKEMAHLNPMALGKKFMDQVTSLLPHTAGMGQRLQGAPVIHALIQAVTQTPVLAEQAKDRPAWVDHMLALMASESGYSLKPQLENIIEDPETGQKKVAAYGLLQHTATNWNAHCDRFKSSPAGKWLVTATVYEQLAKLWSVNPRLLLIPYGERSAKSLEVYQFTPALSQMILLRDRLNANFAWSSEGWVPRNPAVAKTLRWKQLKYAYGAQLKDFLFGRQVLLTVMHTNGTSFWVKNEPLHYPGRPKKDLLNFYLLATDARLRNPIITMIKRRLWVLPATISSTQLLTGGDDVAAPADLSIKAVPTSRVSIPKGDAIEVTSKFSTRVDPLDKHKHEEHKGVDLVIADRSRPTLGATVRSPFTGVVTHSAWNEDGGNQMYIDHGVINGARWQTRYAHLMEPGLPKGSAVNPGDAIAKAGNTGKHTTAAHLHFALLRNGKHVDPELYKSELGLTYESLFA